MSLRPRDNSMSADPRLPLIRPAATFSRREKGRSGFTLVEMLVVIVIIGILASLALAALFASQEAARRSRTEGLIAVLNNQMALRWDSYSTRRLPVSQVFQDYMRTLELSPPVDLKQVAVAQLIARRQLMRIELPDRWWDVAFDDNEMDGDMVPYTWAPPVPPAQQLAPTFFDQSADALGTAYVGSQGPAWKDGIVGGTLIQRDAGASWPWPQVDRQRINLIQRTSLSYSYQRRYQQVIQQPTPPDESLRRLHQGAECLFMILTTNLGDETTGGGVFNERDSADTDGDGFREFVDGWGRPIAFLRWAPGFRSDMQSGDPDRDHDPFDPRKVDPIAFRLFPLIWSAGTDGANEDDVIDPYGIERHSNPFVTDTTLVDFNDPYAPAREIGGTYVFRGERRIESGGVGPNDNVFNQMIQVR